MLGMSALARAGSLPIRWSLGLRWRESPTLDHARLHWYRDATRTYQVTARYIVPAVLRLLARVDVQGLENMPLSGPVLRAPNHRDNLDPYLLLHLVPRTVHVAARPDAFGTGLTLLAKCGAVAVFPQATISPPRRASGAVDCSTCAPEPPVIPIAISGTEAVHPTSPFLKRAPLSARFGAPLRFTRSSSGAPRSLAVAEEILRHISSVAGRRSARGRGLSEPLGWPQRHSHREVQTCRSSVMQRVTGRYDRLRPRHLDECWRLTAVGFVGARSCASDRSLTPRAVSNRWRGIWWTALSPVDRTATATWAVC